MLKEFKEFAIKGNALDMAVGIVIGAAFGTIVKSLVSDIIMPPIGILLGNVDFSSLYFLLKEGQKAAGPYASLSEAQNAGAVTVNYGVFLNNVVSFFIVALSTFILVKSFSRFKMKENTAIETPVTKDCPQCFTSIPLKAKRCPHCTSTLG